MIDTLKKEIAELEKVLLEKKDQLNELIDDGRFANKNQLIVIVELHDQFYNISDITLIENTPEGIELFENSYKNSLYHYEYKFYKVSDLRKEYKYLQEMHSLNDLGEDPIIEWMNENEDNRVNK